MSCKVLVVECDGVMRVELYRAVGDILGVQPVDIEIPYFLPCYWFKPLEKRVEIATRFLVERERKRQTKKMMSEQLQVMANDIVKEVAR